MSAHHPRAGLCNTHRKYYMDCAVFDALWERACGRCEICDVTPEKTGHGKLHIDHDPLIGHWGVRGLLCSPCNSNLDRLTRSPRRAAYLANPWWEHILAMYGVPREGIPEPPVGARVAIGTNLGWHRTERGWERITNLHRRRGDVEPWSLIATAYGPHRVRVGGRSAA